MPTTNEIVEKLQQQLLETNDVADQIQIQNLINQTIETGKKLSENNDTLNLDDK